MNRPLLLLLITGAALGLNFPLGKLAMAAGVDPALWAAYISGGAGLALLVISRFAEAGRSKAGGLLRYAAISGLISYVVPNFLTYSAVSKIGAGLTAMMFALSPVVTACLSFLLRVRPPSLLGVAGIALGLAGAMVIITARNPDMAAASAAWLPVALMIPVFLGIGNVYRTLAWPAGASPMQLASLTNLAAVVPLLLCHFALAPASPVSALFAAPGLMATQLVVSTVTFITFFRLQQLGGPTYLSQIGYVAAVVGAGAGVVFMGERYPLTVWLGAAVVAAGIGLSTWGQLRQAKLR